MADQKVVLLVSLKFASIADRDEVLAAWQPLAAYVRDNEDGCLAYEAITSQSDPLQVMLFERYISDEYIDKVHCTSQLFQDFFGGYLADDAPWRKDHSLELSLQKYSETGIGHMQK